MEGRDTTRVWRRIGRVRAGSSVDPHVTDQTASALPAILGFLRESGLECVTVPVLLRGAPAP